jgi:tetratricopeptide (TPR) repeat protein
MRGIGAFCVVAALCAGTAGAAPIDAEKKAAARRFFDTATLLYERGEFLDAAKEFERAYGEAPIADFLYNIATAYDKGGAREKAAAAYRRYATEMPDSKDAGFAQKRAEVLEKEAAELKAARAAPAAPQRKLPPALPFVEPVTKYTYKTWVDVEGKPYTLLGAGARKVSLFKVYAMGLYVDDEAARAAFPSLAAKAGGSDHDTLLRGDLVNQWLTLADFGKMAWLHFVRDVKAKDTRDSYREALGDAGSPSAPPDLHRDVEAFLNLFDDVKSGEDILIRTTPEGQIIVEAGGKKKLGPKNVRLAHQIWDIWMGSKPINADLKRRLIDRIDTLGL